MVILFSVLRSGCSSQSFLQTGNSLLVVTLGMASITNGKLVNNGVTLNKLILHTGWLNIFSTPTINLLVWGFYFWVNFSSLAQPDAVFLSISSVTIHSSLWRAVTASSGTFLERLKMPFNTPGSWLELTKPLVNALIAVILIWVEVIFSFLLLAGLL